MTPCLPQAPLGDKKLHKNAAAPPPRKTAGAVLLAAADLNRAEALLQTPEVPHNGYYAFVCEKCAPTFRYFGRFAYADELKQRSDEIYERS